MDDATREILDLSGLTENEEFDLEPNRDKWVYISSKASGRGIITIHADCTAPMEMPVEISED